MKKQMNEAITKNRSKISCLAIIVLLVATLGAHPVTATTYISVEPIPSRDVVGQNALDVLASNGAISTVNSVNTRFLVAAGGFEAITDPSYVFTVQDSGPNAVSAADINVLDNALGYVLNQGGTAHFSPDNARAYDFSLDYAVVTFAGTLS